MLDVVIAGNGFHDAREVIVTLRPEGADASFELTQSGDGIDPLFFGRPSAVKIYADFRDGRELLFEGFLAIVEDAIATAKCQCVDGKKFLEGSMLETDYTEQTQTYEDHVELLLTQVRNTGYYAPASVDCRVAGSVTFGATAGQHIRGVLDELLKAFEWTVTDDTLVIGESIGTDRTESVTIRSDTASNVTDFLDIANVVLATSEDGSQLAEDTASQTLYGYARGAVERVDGKTGSGVGDHAEAVLARRKTANPVWSTQKALKTFLFIQAGDTLSVALPSSRLNEAPQALRVAEAVYDFQAGVQTLALSSDAKRPRVIAQRIKELEEKVRVLNL